MHIRDFRRVLAVDGFLPPNPGCRPTGNDGADSTGWAPGVVLAQTKAPADHKALAGVFRQSLELHRRRRLGGPDECVGAVRRAGDLSWHVAQ